ncbi:MAG: hypothetical protein HY606_12475, partial [Planctomycetes bacterium]|nr:hypothetical protein [Planctomycetota bacterium]
MKTHLRRFVTLFFVTMIFCASSCLRSRSEEAAGNITAESNPGDHKESSNINGQASKSSVTTLHTPIGFFEDNAVTLMENVNIGVLRTGRRSKHILANDIQIDKDILRLAAVKMVQLFCTIESQKKPATAAEEAHLVNYLKALAERYDGDGIDDDPSGVVINYYQVGNELDFVDSAWKGTWLEYTQTVRLMHDAILSENPNAKICLFGLLGTEKSVKDFKDVVLKKFKDEMIQSGKPQPFHIIDIHNYFLQGASTVALKYEEVVTYASQIKTKLDEFGMTAEFCITESGTWSGEAVLLSGAPGTHHTEQQHAIDIIKRLVYPVAHGFSFTLWTQMLENSDFSGWQIFTKVGLIHNSKNTSLHLNDDNKDGVPDNWKKLGYYSY